MESQSAHASLKLYDLANDDIIVPGSFVVLQGVQGDGASNSIDSFPLLPLSGDDDDNGSESNSDSGSGSGEHDEEDDDYQHLHLRTHADITADITSVLFSDSRPESRNPLAGTALVHNALSTFMVHPLTFHMNTSVLHSQMPQNDDSFIVVDEDANFSSLETYDKPPSAALQRSSRPDRSEPERKAIANWSVKRRGAELNHRKEWIAAQDVQGNPWLRDRAWMRNDTWWLDQDGRLAVFRNIPERSVATGLVLRHVVSALAPGCTIVGTELVCLETTTFRPVDMYADSTHKSKSKTCPRGRAGWLQLLKIESPCNGWVVLSIDGVPFLGPGLPALYVDPNVWMWRVTCGVGAYVREGLELTSSDPIGVLPFGSFFRVTEKVINQMGLARLRIRARVPTRDSYSYLEGWISEYLNPMSGQQGPIAQPVPFPVPALYKVTLPQGAVIRSGMELSSSPVGHAAVGSLLSVVGRAFSEHPQDKCIERLRLAGNGGWISIRLCEDPPHDELVVQLVGLDGSFDPWSPGTFHLDSQLRVEQQVSESSVEEQSNIIRGFEEVRRGELSEIGDGSDSSSTPTTMRTTAIETTTTTGVKKKKSGVTRRPRRPPHEIESCLICLTEERTATIVHGETGHICCCLQCARILKQHGDRCPVCRLPIEMVIQHFHA